MFAKFHLFFSSYKALTKNRCCIALWDHSKNIEIIIFLNHFLEIKMFNDKKKKKMYSSRKLRNISPKREKKKKSRKKKNKFLTDRPMFWHLKGNTIFFFFRPNKWGRWICVDNVQYIFNGLANMCNIWTFSHLQVLFGLVVLQIGIPEPMISTCTNKNQMEASVVSLWYKYNCFGVPYYFTFDNASGKRKQFKR